MYSIKTTFHQIWIPLLPVLHAVHGLTLRCRCWPMTTEKQSNYDSSRTDHDLVSAIIVSRTRSRAVPSVVVINDNVGTLEAWCVSFSESCNYNLARPGVRPIRRLDEDAACRHNYRADNVSATSTITTTKDQSSQDMAYYRRVVVLLEHTVGPLLCGGGGGDRGKHTHWFRLISPNLHV